MEAVEHITSNAIHVSQNSGPNIQYPERKMEEKFISIFESQWKSNSNLLGKLIDNGMKLIRQ